MIDILVVGILLTKSTKSFFDFVLAMTLLTKGYHLETDILSRVITHKVK